MKKLNAKVAVINFSGNVGKTTIARNLFAPRLNAKVVAIESINSDGQEDEMLRAKQYGELSESLPILDNIVVDIGASNSEDFITYMKQYAGSHQDFDIFVVPVTPSQKQIKDTISTIESLRQVGIPSKKIKVVFNQVDPDTDIKKVFAPLLAYANDSAACVINESAKLFRNDIFPRLAGSNKTISSYAQDKTDYKGAIAQEESTEAKLFLSRELANKRLAEGVIQEHDNVFKLLVSA